MEYIDKGSIYKRLCGRAGFEIDLNAVEIYMDGFRLCNIGSLLDSLTPEDVAPVRHAKWEAVAFRVWKCSECWNTLGVGGEPFDIADKPPFKYCPHCGAKMDEDTEGDTK